MGSSTSYSFAVSFHVNSGSSSPLVCDVAISTDQTPDANDYWLSQDPCATGTCPGFMTFTPSSSGGGTYNGTVSGEAFFSIFSLFFCVREVMNGLMSKSKPLEKNTVTFYPSATVATVSWDFNLHQPGMSTCFVTSLTLVLKCCVWFVSGRF